MNVSEVLSKCSNSSKKNFKKYLNNKTLAELKEIDEELFLEISKKNTTIRQSSFDLLITKTRSMIMEKILEKADKQKQK